LQSSISFLVTMKIISTGFACVHLLLIAAFAADPEDLYTRTGTDLTPAQLIANGSIVFGEDFSTRTVRGSHIAVNHPLLQQQTGVLGAFSALSGVHIPVSGRRTDYADITRWYQADGNTHIFRLFEGENNYRYPIPAEAPRSRVEGVSPTLAVAPGTWRVWEGTYTIIHPLSSTIFQLFHEGSDLWSFHLGMSVSGNINFNRRSEVPGLPTNITLATNMAGKSLGIRIRANGLNYEVYRKIPLVDPDWQLVTIGSYQQSPSNSVIFRCGMYPGSQVGTTANDGMLFVSGARFSVSTEPAAPPPPPPVAYYRDQNGAAAGFGTAGGTWAAPTTGSTTQGWSASATGATLPGSVTTTFIDPVNFGTSTTGGGLGSGTITVSGKVSCADLSFGSQSGNITLTGGEIFNDANLLIKMAGLGQTHTIHSVLSGTGTRTFGGSSTLALYGNNTFEDQVILGNNTHSGLRLLFNTVRNAGAGPSSLGAPRTTAGGVIQIGANSYSSTLEFTNATAAQTTDRQVRIGSNANGSGSATILSSNTNPAHSLTFSNPVLNVATVGASSSRSLTLGGINTGNNTISGTIINNSGGRIALSKAGTGTWVLAGPTGSYSNGTSIHAGTLKLGANNPLPFGVDTSNLNVNGGTTASAAGTLDLRGFQLAVNGLGGTAAAVQGRIVNNATGTVSTLTLGHNDAMGTFSGLIANNTSGTGTVALTKTGTGTQTLESPNTYSGATNITAGTLALGVNGSIAASPVTIRAGAVLNTTAHTTYVIPAAPPLTFGINPSGTGSSGTLIAAGLNITSAPVGFTLINVLNDPVYILATYTSLTGSAFASTTNLPPGYSLKYAHEGNKIALVRDPVVIQTTLFSDNFDGSPAATLNGTTPDITTGGAAWISMNGADTEGKIYADGDIQITGGASANRGGSATLAFTPENGFTYTLSLSALNLDSTSSNSTANRLYFGFAKGQNAGNGPANNFTVTQANVQGQITQGFMTKVGYAAGSNPGLGGAPSASFNDATSTTGWSALATTYGGNIDLRIVLDTRVAGNWTATWYAKLNTAAAYSVTRATGVVNTKDINSIGFGLPTFTSGRISSFTLTKTEIIAAFPPVTGLDPAAFGGDTNLDGVSDGLAFLLGASDSNVSAAGTLPTVTQSGDGLVMTFSMRNSTSRGGATLSLQHSSDFGNSDPWTSVLVPDNEGTTISGDVTFDVTLGAEFNTVRATIPATEATNGRLFARLIAQP
jgi:autotransporter-associated beta strand protein